MNRLPPSKLSAALLLAAALGCTVVKPEPLPPAPKVVSFTATPATLSKPGKVTLEWQTQNATTVEVRDGAGAALAGVDNRAAGSLEVEVQGDALFVLAARNERGVLDSATAPVQVTSGPREVTFIATPSTLLAGDTALLAWSAPGAKTLEIAPAGGAPLDLKGQLSAGTIAVSPTATTTYELDLGTAKHAVTVTVAPKILSLTATPSAAKAAAPLTLAWQTLGATKVTLQTTAGQVLATETEPAKVQAGSATVNIPGSAAPSDVFSYVLLAETSGGQSSLETVTVYLSGTPVITSLTAPEYALAGGTFVISWKTSDTDVVRVSSGDVILFESPSAAIAASGSVTLKTPAQPTAYRISAVNLRGGTTTQLKTVTAVPKTTLVAFDANPQPGIGAGGDPVSLSWNIPGARRLRISVAGQYTVYTARGPGAETGALTVYPNANTEYTLDADNTIGDAVQGKKTITVGAPAAFTTPPGALLQGNPAPLAYSVGGGSALIHGLSHFTVDVDPASGGFLDIKPTGTKLTPASLDDTTTTFSLAGTDFETWLFGARAPAGTSTTVTVGINGFMAFGSFSSSRPTNDSLPTANADTQFLAPFWDDLVLGPTSGLYWQVTGEAPEKRLIVQWDEVKVKGDAASSLTFQVQVSQVGVVTYEYKTVTATGVPSVTIGAQGPLKTMGLTYTGALPTAGTSLTFFGPKPSPVGPVLQELGPYAGWVKIGSAYLKLTFTASSYIKRGDLILSEVMAAPAAAIAATGEWLEVYNSTASPVELAGWTLDFGPGSTHVLAGAAGTTVVPAKGFLLLGQSNVPAENDGVAVQYVYGPTYTLPDAAGTVRLQQGAYALAATWGAGLGAQGASVGTDLGVYLAEGDTSAAPHPLACTSQAPFGSQTPQQLGSPGVGSSCFKYALATRPVAYKDVSATGTALIPAAEDNDENIFTADLASAPFPAFGTPVSSLSVATNGFIAFKLQACPTSLCFFTNKTLPNSGTDPFGILAAYWDDLELANTGANIFSKRMAAGEDTATPAPHWIIQWHKATHFASTSDNLNFQVKLFDDGAIELHFGAMSSTTASYANGAGATVWLEEPSGKVAKVIGVNQPVIAPNTAYRFSPL